MYKKINVSANSQILKNKSKLFQKPTPWDLNIHLLYNRVVWATTLPSSLPVIFFHLEVDHVLINPDALPLYPCAILYSGTQVLLCIIRKCPLNLDVFWYQQDNAIQKGAKCSRKEVGLFLEWRTDQACSYELQGSGQIYVLRSFSGKIKELAFRRSQLRQTPGSLTEMSTARQMETS